MLTLVLTGTPLRYDVGTHALSPNMTDPAIFIQLARSMRPKNFSGLDRDWPSWKLQLKT